MSEQEDKCERLSTWLNSTDAKREFFLNSVDLNRLKYECLRPAIAGRPTKLWNPEDLKKAELEKTKMSEQEDQCERLSTWLNSTDAKREFFLSSDDLNMLKYECLRSARVGRPTKLWNPEDLKKAAIEKYGQKEFQAKIDKKAHRKAHHCAIFNNGKEFIESIKHTEGKKRKRALSEDGDDGNDKGDDESHAGLEELCGIVKKCNKEQLEQIVTLMAQTSSSFLELFEKVKLVSLLPRSKFQTVYPELAKLLSTADDENYSGHTECTEDDDDDDDDDDEEGRDDASNLDLEGSWTLHIVAPPRIKGEEGSLDVIFFSSGSSVNGSICFPSSSCLGDIVGFKTTCTMEDTRIYFKTRSELKHEWYTGVLQTCISRDEKGFQVSGSFWPGFKEQDLPKIQFIGRKAEGYCS